MSQVIEKGCGICVFLIDLIPEAREPENVDVTADQGGFSRTCRARNPDDGSSPHAVQKRKQPLPWQNFGEDRTSDFAHD